MDHASIFSGAAFRTAVHAALAVMATLIATALMAFLFVQQTLEQEIQREILTEQVMLREIYDKGGEAALLRTIAEINNPVSLSRRAIGAFGPDGLKLAGNIAQAPGQHSFARTALRIAGKGDAALPYYVYTTLFDQIVLVIGHDLSAVTATERRLVLALIGSGLAAGLVILLIGYASSRKSLRKLNSLEATLNEVSQGDTAIRVPVTGENDQIDRIALRINTHLDRLSSLMVTTKSTAIAIAHDLKTPLSRAQLALQSAVALIDKGQDPTAAVDSIDAELTRLNRIFDAILRISRIESSTKRAEFKVFDLWPVIGDLAETFAPMAEECGQTLSLLPQPSPEARVLGDERMIRQMIVNLIQNAISHGTPGNAIAIGFSNNNGAITLRIADTGPGIPQAEHARVFEPFYRLDSSRSSDGSGLGLALVKAIAERHSIKITLGDNAPGLTVDLHFPVPAPNLSKS